MPNRRKRWRKYRADGWNGALYMGVVCAVAWFIPGIQFAGVLIGLLSLHGAVFIWGVFALAKTTTKINEILLYKLVQFGIIIYRCITFGGNG